MTIDELLAKLLRISADRITEDASMKTIAEWDSLKHIELIVGIEQHYGIELTGDEIAEMTSVKAIKTILKKHGLCN